MRTSLHYLKLVADQRIVFAQFNYGNCLQKGEGVEIDFRGAAHHFKLAADQRTPFAQLNYGLCLQKGEGVSIDFRGAAHYFKLAADQRIADAQYFYAICLRNSDSVEIFAIQFSQDPPPDVAPLRAYASWESPVPAGTMSKTPSHEIGAPSPVSSAEKWRHSLFHATDFRRFFADRFDFYRFESTIRNQ
jgi:TPR repeat protein